MNCSNCGNILADYMKFCTKCGVPISATNPGTISQAMVSGSSTTPTPMGEQSTPAGSMPLSNNPAPVANNPVPQVEVNPWLEFKRIYLVLMAVVAGFSVITLLGALATGTLTSSEPPSFMFIFRFGLMLFSFFGALSVFYGIILCIVFLVLAKKPTAHQLYYNRNALWVVLGPILMLVTIFACFFIGNVISRFMSV